MEPSPNPRKRTLSSESVKKVDRRTSLPSTIKSATVMTKQKLTARRRSLSSRNKDHQNLYSPPETRSAKKRRTSSIGVTSGCVLTFSPPDQKENARREKEALEKRQKAKSDRVQKLKDDGHLLVYDINGNAIIGLPKNAASKTLATPPLPPPFVREIIQQQSEQRKKENEALIEKVVQLQNTEQVETLKSDKLVLEEKLGTLKEELSTATNQLERLSELEKSQESLKLQTDKLLEEKATMERQMVDLQTELHRANKQIVDEQAKLSDLQKVADSASSNKEELESTIASYKKKVGDLESVRIPELEILINTEKDNVARMELKIESLENELNSRDAKIQELANEISSQQNCAKEDLNVKEELEAKCAEQACRIDALEAEVFAHKSTLQAQEQELANHSNTLKTEENRFIADRKQLNDELENASNLLESLVQEKQALQLKVGKLERSLQEASEERDEARSNMQGFDERENELYRKLREGERVRRQMHGRIMQLMGNIRVFVRVRPQLPNQASSAKAHFKFLDEYGGQGSSKVGEDLTKSFLELTEPYKDRGGLSDRRKNWRYGFDGVFTPKATQVQVWNAVEPLIQCAVDGSPVTLFAYGQTGSGKTYTMLGGKDSSEEGIIGRSVRMMFDQKTELEGIEHGETKVDMSVALLEVYNEQVFDLVSGTPGRENLIVGKDGNVASKVVEVKSLANVMKILKLAQERRCVKKTASNEESSRSHMIFTLHFNVSSSGGEKRQGKLNICDLAGSERVKKSLAQGQTLEESKKINSSLSTLSNVIASLQAGNPLPPFRESKLTMLLKPSLEGNSKTMAIVCCSPDEEHFQETRSSLEFAKKASCVELKEASSFRA